MKGAADRLDDQVRAEGAAMGYDASTGDAGASSTNFTAVMHNVVNQMLLAMKAGEAAAAPSRRSRPAKSRCSRSPTPWRRSSRTIQIRSAFKPGDEMPGDFGHVLMKYLDRTRTVIIRSPSGRRATSRSAVPDRR
jgi:hypothetical protein